MLKAVHIFLFLVLSQLQPMPCQDEEIIIESEIQFLKARMGFCLNYFEYLQFDGFFIGKLTLPNIKVGDNIKLQFYRRGFAPKMTFKGTLLPDEGPQEVLKKIQNNQPITYRVDFPVAFAEPELIKIFINGEELCSTILKIEGESVILEHTFEVVNNSLPVFTNNINMPHFPKISNCGLIDDELSKPTSSDVGDGARVRRGEFPWLAAIYSNQTDKHQFICSGSLVTSRLILTAAHCLQGLSTENIVVTLGGHNLTNTAEDNVVMSTIDEVILHPEFKPILSFSDADLALLQMSEALSFTKFIKPICLWSEPADEELIVGRDGVTAGWGSDENGNTISAVPRKAKTTIVSKAECQRSSPVFTAITSARTFCAGSPDGTGPCEGDSGGGLMMYRNGLWMLRGVISAGLSSQQRCNLQEYTVYCDIAQHTEWLDGFIREEELVTGAIEDVCGTIDSGAHFEHPWLAAVYTKTLTGIYFLCTGVLISPFNILTSAGCYNLDNGGTAEAASLRVYLGRNNLNSIKETGVIVRDVASVIKHKDYEKTVGLYYDNDIAMLDMKSPVSFTQHIKPICYWNEPEDQSEIVGQSVTLASWDKLGVFAENMAVRQSLDVDVVPLQQCQAEGYRVAANATFLCTPRFGNNADGVLMIKRNDRWLLRGIGSADLLYLPRYNFTDFRLYTDVAKYASWIESNILS